RDAREKHAIAPGSQGIVEIHAESQSDDAILQHLPGQGFAELRKGVAERQSEKDADEKRHGGRQEKGSSEKQSETGPKPKNIESEIHENQKIKIRAELRAPRLYAPKPPSSANSRTERT
ncbi:MAG: hypothetical protein K2O82_05525, partial [Alistipes sp.]|nr:hypothetical protein [Alistipes sp.]